jgi:hypothetical protein
MKKGLVAVAIVMVASLVAHLHASIQTYHPVVKVASPDGVTYTAVFEAVPDRPSCGANSMRFLEPMRDYCPDCEVLSARCERDLTGQDLAIALDLPSPFHIVVLQGMRIAIAADAARARRTCDFMAAHAVREGAPSATCIFPRAAARAGET